MRILLFLFALTVYRTVEASKNCYRYWSAFQGQTYACVPLRTLASPRPSPAPKSEDPRH